MAVRIPIYYDVGTGAIREMNSSQINALKSLARYAYGTDPSVTVSVGTGDTLLGTLSDSFLRAGSATFFTNRYPTVGELTAVTTSTVNYNTLYQSLQTSSLPENTGNIAYPAYIDGSDNIRTMTADDVIDTFIKDAITSLIGSYSSSTPGTYTVFPSTFLADSTLESGSAVFTDTIANLGAFTSAGIPEYQTQTTPVNSWYLFKRNAVDPGLATPPLKISSGGNLIRYAQIDLQELFKNFMRYSAINTPSYRIRYSINGSGTTRGTMTDTKYNSSARAVRFENADKYWAQMFPAGTATTISTYLLRIRSE
jgi:hypothetical protein